MNYRCRAISSPPSQSSSNELQPEGFRAIRTGDSEVRGMNVFMRSLVGYFRIELDGARFNAYECAPTGRNIVRTHKPKKTSRQAVDEESMQSAIQDVIQGVLSYRKAADKYNLKLSTLQNRVKKYRNNNDAEGSSSPKWEENKMAGKEWMYGFRRRNLKLSLRKPENTSAARSFAFKKTSVTEFYTNLKTVFERHPLTANRIFNFDESGISTVLAIPKVLAPRCQKQVREIVSAESGELVTFGGIITASGNTIPPLFLFPRVHYKDNFLEGAPEGSLGAVNKSSWINSNIFVCFKIYPEAHKLLKT
ncbi:hypothetical protein EVAR_84514_1 [Eumeta japonica]|uniref:HTH psq-type domain-containing protein n=1 Tax=Eumeta variegata TaxID=151549 RepID=A0A4C1UHR1_EUMVA|nr:hypothetical protein EVAR_84514_1 [Eumeta japonica]